MRELKAIEYKCGLIAVIVGFGLLYSYYVRELMASLVLFTMASFLLGAVALGVFLIWSAGEKVAIWIGLTSRNLVALTHRFIIAHARP